MQAYIQERAQGKDIKPDIHYMEADHHDAIHNKAITDFNKALKNFTESNEKAMPLIKETVGEKLAKEFENSVKESISSIKLSVLNAKTGSGQSYDFQNTKNRAIDGLKTIQGKISYLANNIDKLATSDQNITKNSKDTLDSISAELAACANGLRSPSQSNGKGRY